MTPERLQEIRERAERERRKIIIGERLKTCLDRDDLLAAYDALSADYAAAIRALRKYAHAARVVVAMKNGSINNKALREAATEIGIPLKECAHVLSTPRAKEVE